MAQEEVQVSVSDAHLQEFAEVVRRLERAGLQVEQQLAAVGVVTGHIDEARLSALSQVAGVASVEHSRTVGIPPGEVGSGDIV